MPIDYTKTIEKMKYMTVEELKDLLITPDYMGKKVKEEALQELLSRQLKR